MKRAERKLRNLIDSHQWDEVEQFDTSTITDMSMLFYKVEGIENLDLSGWDVSNVEDMSYMFAESDFGNESIAGWDVSNVEDMSYMFAGNNKFTGHLIDCWTPNKLNNFVAVFDASCYDIPHWLLFLI